MRFLSHPTPELNASFCSAQRLLFCGHHLFSFLCSDFEAQEVEYFLCDFLLTWVPRVQEGGDTILALEDPTFWWTPGPKGKAAGALEKKQENKCKTTIMLSICAPKPFHIRYFPWRRPHTWCGKRGVVVYSGKATISVWSADPKRSSYLVSFIHSSSNAYRGPTTCQTLHLSP